MVSTTITVKHMITATFLKQPLIIKYIAKKQMFVAKRKNKYNFRK